MSWTNIYLPITTSLLLASTMSSTDSASVFAILRSQKMNLKHNLRPMLELESGSNDPMAYMLTIVLIQFIQSGGMGIAGIFGSFDDAQDWFMDQLPAGDGRFEVANSDKDLTEFSGGKTGYHIELHDNNKEGDTKVGDFYIDSSDGKVYRSDEHGKTFAEYDFSDYK